jgi:hypothetical protein
MSPKMRDEIKSRMERAANVYGDDRAEWPDETFILSQAYDAWKAEHERADKFEEIANEAIKMILGMQEGHLISLSYTSRLAENIKYFKRKE